MVKYSRSAVSKLNSFVKSKTGKKPRMKRRYKGRLPFSKKQVSAIKKIAVQSGETKIFTTTDALDTSVEVSLGTTFDWTGAVPLLVVEGTGEEQRIGDEITLQSYNFRMKFNSNVSGNVNMRLLCVYFPDNDGTGFASLMTDGVNSPLPRKEAFGSGSYKVLMDRYFCGIPNPASTGKVISQYYNLYIPVKGLKVQYDSSATTRNRGNIKMFMLTDSDVDSLMTQDIDTISILRYKD